MARNFVSSAATLKAGRSFKNCWHLVDPIGVDQCRDSSCHPRLQCRRPQLQCCQWKLQHSHAHLQNHQSIIKNYNMDKISMAKNIFLYKSNMMVICLCCVSTDLDNRWTNMVLLYSETSLKFSVVRKNQLHLNSFKN